MSKRIRWFFVVIFPIFAFTATAIWAVPYITDQMKQASPFMQILPMLFVIVLFAGYQLIPVRRHYSRFSRFEQSRAEILESLHRLEFEKILNKKITGKLKLSIMLLTYRRFNIREPRNKAEPHKRKLSYSKCFQYAYESENMSGGKESQLEWTINQGLCGEVCRELQALSADLRICSELNHFNLNSEQLNTTKNVKAIFSVPIRMKKDGRLTTKVIGCLNVSSESDEFAKILFTDFNGNMRKRAQLEKKCTALAELCSNIF